jgi:hypothetical protein
MKATDLDRWGLEYALRIGSVISPATEAAVDLIIADDFWLGDHEFLNLVDVNETAGELIAEIRWLPVAELCGTAMVSIHRRVTLRLACSLAGYAPGADGPRSRWSLRWILESLDPQGRRHALQAIRRALPEDEPSPELFSFRRTMDGR